LVHSKHSRGNVTTKRLPRFVSPTTQHLLANPAASRQLAVVERPEYEPRKLSGWKLQKLRERKREEDPLCAHCREKGIVRAWDELDHRVPLREGGTDDESNLQGLCFECHAIKSAEESRRANAGSDGHQNFSKIWRGGDSISSGCALQNAPPQSFTAKTGRFEENVSARSERK
jgi:5-methylcytosine-specific restriction protein A